MTIKRVLGAFWWMALAALFLAPGAIAQTSVTLTGVQGTSYDGIYVSPYYATVNGVTNTPVVCDDFGDESTLGSQWNATVTPLSGVSSSNTAWGKDLADLSLYYPVVYLTQQVLQQAPGSPNQIIDTYLLWAVFDPSGVEGYLAKYAVNTGPLTTAALCNDIFGTVGCTSSVALPGSMLYNAENATYTASEFSNFEVISPNIGTSSTVCTAESTGMTACAAQEFIARVPEGGAAFAYLFLAGLCCFGAIYARSRCHNASVKTA
jgi:hypothetical protein